MTYADVDLVPLMRIHLEVFDPLLPIGKQRLSTKEWTRLDCEACVAIEPRTLFFSMRTESAMEWYGSISGGFV